MARACTLCCRSRSTLVVHPTVGTAGPTPPSRRLRRQRRVTCVQPIRESDGSRTNGVRTRTRTTPIATSLVVIVTSSKKAMLSLRRRLEAAVRKSKRRTANASTPASTRQAREGRTSQGQSARAAKTPTAIATLNVRETSAAASAVLTPRNVRSSVTENAGEARVGPATPPVDGDVGRRLLLAFDNSDSDFESDPQDLGSVASLLMCLLQDRLLLRTRALAHRVAVTLTWC